MVVCDGAGLSIGADEASIVVNGLRFLTLFQPLVFLRSVQMVTNQKVLSNRASDKSRVSRVGSIVTAVISAFQKGGGRLLSEQGLALYTRLASNAA